jgi:glycosyltransferase involved in cell wall biosynthesis
VKIALLSHMHHPIAEPYEGGTEAHTAMLADELVARGHDVTLFAKEGSVSAARVYPLVPKDFEFTNLASPLVRKQQKGFLAEAVHHSIEAIAEGEFDVIVNNSLSSLPFSDMRELRMLTILHTPANLDDVTAIVGRAGWTPSPLHRYVTVSESNARGWRGLLPEVDVVPNGIKLDSWRSDVAPTPGLAVWAARITREKGLHLAIDAARSAGMQFEFAGPVSRVDYWDSEIALWEEPFGLTVVEALAAGTPVAALPNGAVRELVGPDAGAISRTTDAAALASAINRARRLPRAAALAAAQRFDYDSMVDGYEQALVELSELALERSA